MVLNPKVLKVKILGQDYVVRSSAGQKYLNEVSKYVKKGNVESAYAALYKRSVLKGFLETEIRHSGK